MRKHLKDMADVSTVAQLIISLIIAISGSGVLAVSLSLSILEFVLLGVVLLLGILSVVLARRNIGLKKVQKDKSKPESASESRNDRHESVEHLETLLLEVKEERDALQRENEDLISSCDAFEGSSTSSAFVEEYATGYEKYSKPEKLPSNAGMLPVLTKLSFRLTDLVRGESIENRTFDNCIIHGPAVILPLDGVITGCTFTYKGDIESILWRMEPYVGKVGIIITRNCIFKDCVFVRIGFAGLEEDLQTIRN